MAEFTIPVTNLFSPNLINNIIPELLNETFPRTQSLSRSQSLSWFNVTTSNQRQKNMYVYQVRTGDGKNCLHFSITLNDNIVNIYLNKLDKCSSDATGTKNLNKLESFADKLQKSDEIIKNNYKVVIELIDESYLTVCDKKISLKYLFLLKSGKSWYNKLGYISSNYTAEQKNNQIVIQRSFEDAFPIVVDNLMNGDNEELNYIFTTTITGSLINPERNTDLLEIVKANMILFENLSTSMKIKDVFANLHKYLINPSCASNIREITFIYLMVLLFRYGSDGPEFKIMYDNELMKTEGFTDVRRGGDFWVIVKTKKVKTTRKNKNNKKTTTTKNK